MGLLLKYGVYEFPRETTMVPMSSGFEFNVAGTPTRRRDVWSVRTVLTAANEAAIKVAVDALVAALVDGYTLTLYQTDGTTKTSHEITPCRILSYGYPEPIGPELATIRTVEITFEAFADVGSHNLVAFQESFSYRGGGARYVTVETIEGDPKRYRTAAKTAYRCDQRGSATGRTGYPVSTGARFPDAQMERVAYDYTSSRSADGDLRYTTTWHFRYESAEPLSGFPGNWGVDT